MSPLVSEGVPPPLRARFFAAMLRGEFAAPVLAPVDAGTISSPLGVEYATGRKGNTSSGGNLSQGNLSRTDSPRGESSLAAAATAAAAAARSPLRPSAFHYLFLCIFFSLSRSPPSPLLLSFPLLRK